MKRMIKTEFIGVRLKPSQKLKLDKLAEENEMTLSEYIRLIVDNHLKKNF